MTVENPVSTVLRLIDNRIVVVKDNDARASIKCTEENYDRELLKNYDAQITCGQSAPSEDQRLNLSGTKRRRIAHLKVAAFAMNREIASSDPGRVMRDKIVEQLNAIIRECRQIPYETTYNFYGLGYPEGTPHKAKDAAANSEQSPSSLAWTELSAANYEKIWSNDDVLHSKATSVATQYPQMLFRFKIGKSENYDLQPLPGCVKRIVLTFVGYGTAAAGDGVTLQVWDNVAGAWSGAVTGTASAKETLTITLTTDLTNYIDEDGYCWVLARTTNPSAGAATTLYCDFVQCVIQVTGLTYCDVVSSSNSDLTDVKPFIYKAEFILRGWLFEDIT
ncbi:MAG: hypothetical protein PHI29_13340 [Gallionella sp.]|nr:hypothetical protein [Gallionella sp.]